jgi:hypothetical protein
MISLNFEFNLNFLIKYSSFGLTTPTLNHRNSDDLEQIIDIFMGYNLIGLSFQHPKYTIKTNSRFTSGIIFSCATKREDEIKIGHIYCYSNHNDAIEYATKNINGKVLRSILNADQLGESYNQLQCQLKDIKSGLKCLIDETTVTKILSIIFSLDVLDRQIISCKVECQLSGIAVATIDLLNKFQLDLISRIANTPFKAIFSLSGTSFNVQDGDVIRTRMFGMTQPDPSSYSRLKKLIGLDETKIPDRFKCPIHLDLITDPAYTLSNPKRNYEFQYLMKALAENNNIDPFTRLKTTLVKNAILQHEINDFLTDAITDKSLDRYQENPCSDIGTMTEDSIDNEASVNNPLKSSSNVIMLEKYGLYPPKPEMLAAKACCHAAVAGNIVDMIMLLAHNGFEILELDSIETGVKTLDFLRKTEYKSKNKDELDQFVQLLLNTYLDDKEQSELKIKLTDGREIKSAILQKTALWIQAYHLHQADPDNCLSPISTLNNLIYSLSTPKYYRRFTQEKDAANLALEAINKPALATEIGKESELAKRSAPEKSETIKMT